MTFVTPNPPIFLAPGSPPRYPKNRKALSAPATELLLLARGPRASLLSALSGVGPAQAARTSFFELSIPALTRRVTLSGFASANESNGLLLAWVRNLSGVFEWGT